MSEHDAVILLEDDKKSSKPVHSFDLKDCPVVAVKVYNDRAEVKRQVKVKLVEGEQKILIKKFPTTTINHTARVSGESESDVTILEVSYKVGSEENKHDQTKKKELQEEADKLRVEQRDLNAELGRLYTENKFIEDYAGSVIDVNPVGVNDDGPGELLEQMTENNTLERVSSFLGFYREQLAKKDNNEQRLRKRLDELDEQLRVLDRKIANHKPETTNDETRELTVLLTQSGSEHNVESEFLVSYQVNNASWHASYDVRVQSGESSLQITYYGIINQKSGEAWRNTRVSLSTANPSLRSSPPTLGGMTLGYKPVIYKEKSRKKKSAMPSMKMAKKEMAYDAKPSSSAAFGGSALFSAPAPPKMAVQTATAEQGATSATYLIPRECTIPSDGNDHKVTIAVINLENCVFNYHAVPKLDANAYLKVKTTNTSPYSLLAGKMNIFFDGNFVSTSTLNAVFPQEEFETYLGRDPSVKIEYKAPTRYRANKGFISRNNSTNVIRTTVIRNMKQVPISITIQEQLPVSSTEQVKVGLIRPDMRSMKQISNVPLITEDENDRAFALTVTLDDQSLLEWNIPVVNPQQTVKVPYEYVVDWPLDKDLNTEI